MVKNVESWISDFKAGARYLYITLPTPKEVRRGEVHLHVPLRHACVRFFSCTPVGAPAGPAQPAAQIHRAGSHPISWYSTMARGLSRFCHTSTFLMDPSRLPTSIRLVPVSVQYTFRPMASTASPSVVCSPAGSQERTLAPALKQTGCFPSSGARQGVPGLEARPTCGDDVLMLRAIQIGTADAVQGTV